jgi:hypothetical protein
MVEHDHVRCLFAAAADELVYTISVDYKAL